MLRRAHPEHQAPCEGIPDDLNWNPGYHPREVFRGAVIVAAAAIVIMHNHPSGEAQPSEADIKVTRDPIRAGQLLKIKVLDHMIAGNLSHCSLRELGYFYRITELI